MIRKIGLVLIACLLLSATAFPVSAEEAAGYSFSAADFPTAGEIRGICLTALPEKLLGVLRLGERVLQAGDVLTAQQLDQMVFSTGWFPDDCAAALSYLPVSKTGMEPEATMHFFLRGRENKPPVTKDLSLETYRDLPIEGRLAASDPEEQTMTYQVIRQPRRGTVQLGEDGSFTYTPKKNKVGIDSFVYTATDDAGKVSEEATVTVTILKPTDASRYTDTMGRDCSFTAEWMKNTGIFVGETVGGAPCFNPESTVSRGEFITMLVKTLDLPAEKVDLTAYDEKVPVWLKPYLAAALRSGLIPSLPEERFNADAPITGAEAEAMLSCACWNEDGFGLAADTLLTREQASLALYALHCLRR